MFRQKQAPIQYLPLQLIRPHGSQPIVAKDQWMEVKLWSFVVPKNTSHACGSGQLKSQFTQVPALVASHVPQLQTHQEEQSTRDLHPLLMSGSWVWTDNHMSWLSQSPCGHSGPQLQWRKQVFDAFLIL